ncbi:MAG: UDP-N-acetylglucosamine 1-carboxyvinyltransferase [Bacilli bacterium]|nr:UDP-N-acetylglucosamine 1-carboxyvinyltransferase [Bacilli bacterium]
MKSLKVIGNKNLNGTIRISGAKNSAVALIPGTLLASGVTTLCNIPNILDIDALEDTLNYLNVKVTRASGSIMIDTTNLENKEIPYELSKRLRASYYFMAILLARFNHMEMAMPGGCEIGTRPIDQTLKAFRLLGAEIIERDEKIIIKADKLIGNTINLDMPSVGATINSILVAVKANGKTIITNAALEPEITDLCLMLNKMGAKISGYGTKEIEIEGVESLDGTNHDIISDRIEAGTYTMIGALCGTHIKIDNIIPEHIKSLTDTLSLMGAHIDIHDDYLIIDNQNTLKSMEIKTDYYPGFPTDLQQPFTALLTQCEGISQMSENIYENRFMNVPYLNRMGAHIDAIGRTATIYGPTKLAGCEVIATDLRAGASLLVAALVADGETTIKEINHLLRGYEEIVEKLTNVGAKIEIEEI